MTGPETADHAGLNRWRGMLGDQEDVLERAILDPMSLVVGQRYSDGVRLVGETRVTEPVRQTPRVAPRTQYLEGVLKVVILHPGLCVGYAGSITAAQAALRELGTTSAAGFTIGDVYEILRPASRKGADFIVATLTPLPGLATVRDGAIHKGWNRAFVGEPAAYSAFRAALERLGGPGTSAHGFGSLSRAMDAVVDSEVVPTVGDLVTEVRCTESGFRYSGRGKVATGPFDPSTAPTDDDPDSWGSAAAGAYYESYLYPRDSGIGALGVYFYQPRLGALFYPARAERAIPYTDVSHEEFVAAVAADHGVVLAGSRIEAHPGRNFVLG